MTSIRNHLPDGFQIRNQMSWLFCSDFSAMILRTELKPLRCFWHFLLHDSSGRLLLGSFLLVPWRKFHEICVESVEFTKKT